MRKLLTWILVVAVTNAVSGCGTMISGRRQDIQLSMTPPDANVAVYRWNGEVVAGPTSAGEGKMNVHRPEWNQPYLVTAFKDGHCPQYWLTTAKTSTGAWFVMPFVVAIAFFPIAGAIVSLPLVMIDASTGGCCAVHPDKFDGLLMEAKACED